jgi:predicted dehydrogenase
MDKPLRGLFVGGGHFAQIQLAAWQEVRGVEMAGICNRSESKAEALAQMFNIPHTGQQLKQMIEEIQPDFVDICTAVETHLPFVRTAADAGIDILCQKPVASTLEESQELVAYCQARGVRLMINENWRWQSWYREIKQILEAGTLGDIYHVYCEMRPGDGWGDEPYPQQPFFRGMERFLLFETGVHYLDTLQYLFGPIASLYCRTRTLNPLIHGEDSAIVHLNFSAGATGVYDGNRVSFAAEVRTPVNGTMRIEGSKGNLLLQPHGQIRLSLRDGQEYEHAYRIASGYRGGGAVQAQQHFIDCLTDGRPFETCGDRYMQTVRLVEACYASAAANSVKEIADEH